MPRFIVHGSTLPLPWNLDRELFVLHRADGSWKIARYMFNKMQLSGG